MPSKERNIVETVRRSAGQATRSTDRDRVAARAEERDMLTQEELNRRQEAIGRTRRPAGPPLQAPPASSSQTAAEAADVPETECADPPEERNIVETVRRSTGQATRSTDRDRVAARAEERDMLTQEELNHRQEAIGRTRRPVGPPLQGPPASSSQTAAEAADVPETECADPPDQG